MIPTLPAGAKKMINSSTKLFLAFHFLIWATNLPAATPPSPAGPSKYVTDYAGVLRGSTADRLSAQLADFDQKTGTELIIVIYPNLPKGVSIGDYTRQLYDGWKIGKRNKDTGALLLIATQERQGRIQAGRGLQTKLTEDACKKIFTENIAPRLDAGDYDGACKAATGALIAAASR
jgi:uncharacterized protein